jgi:DNA-binding response OmpR family regulator
MTITELTRIMYVDDETDIQTVVRLSLETIGGFTAKTCHSAENALQCMNDFEPDLFLLDVMMPEMDGPSLLKEIRKIEKFENIPAIFMTAKAQTNEIEMFKSYSGVAGVIVKPFNPVELPNEIRQLWRNYYGL